MTVYITEDQNTTFYASRSGEEWILDTGVTIGADGVALDAAGTATGQNFILKGHLVSHSGPFFRIGDQGLGNAATSIKFDIQATAVSNGTGFAGLSGGLSILNVGSLSSALTLFDLTGSDTAIENDATMRSETGQGFVVRGDRFRLDNNDGSIWSAGTILAITGEAAVINNNAKMQSGTGAGIHVEGAAVTITNNSRLIAKLDAVVIAGSEAVVTNNLTIRSDEGDGIRVAGDALRLENNGTVRAGGDGIVVSGAGYDIVNHKKVVAADIGLRLDGDGAVLSQGEISGRIAVKVESGAVNLTNTNELTATGAKTAAVVASHDGMEFTNLAAVYAKSGLAFKGGRGVDVVDNRGWLEGSVKLGAGDDVFLSSDGQVGGTVFGGKGDDLYVINSAIRVQEKKGQGIDTVESTDSYQLGANFENLVLTGAEKTYGIGNGLDNIITGNASANRLEGRKGNDVLNGGAGNDTLYGNAGADTFIFEPGSGRDRIMDFVAGEDRISLSAFVEIASFADVKAHLGFKHGNALITIGSDHLVIVGGADMQLSAHDFIF